MIIGKGHLIIGNTSGGARITVQTGSKIIGGISIIYHGIHLTITIILHPYITAILLDFIT
jgi:hypothetical protein